MIIPISSKGDSSTNTSTLNSNIIAVHVDSNINDTNSYGLSIVPPNGSSIIGLAMGNERDIEKVTSVPVSSVSSVLVSPELASGRLIIKAEGTPATSIVMINDNPSYVSGSAQSRMEIGLKKDGYYSTYDFVHGGRKVITFTGVDKRELHGKFIDVLIKRPGESTASIANSHRFWINAAGTSVGAPLGISGDISTLHELSLYLYSNIGSMSQSEYLCSVFKDVAESFISAQLAHIDEGINKLGENSASVGISMCVFGSIEISDSATQRIFTTDAYNRYFNSKTLSMPLDVDASRWDHLYFDFMVGSIKKRIWLPLSDSSSALSVPDGGEYTKLAVTISTKKSTYSKEEIRNYIYNTIFDLITQSAIADKIQVAKVEDVSNPGISIDVESDTIFSIVPASAISNTMQISSGDRNVNTGCKIIFSGIKKTDMIPALDLHGSFFDIKEENRTHRLWIDTIGIDNIVDQNDPAKHSAPAYPSSGSLSSINISTKIKAQNNMISLMDLVLAVKDAITSRIGYLFIDGGISSKIDDTEVSISMILGSGWIIVSFYGAGGRGIQRLAMGAAGSLYDSSVSDVHLYKISANHDYYKSISGKAGTYIDVRIGSSNVRRIEFKTLSQYNTTSGIYEGVRAAPHPNGTQTILLDLVSPSSEYCLASLIAGTILETFGNSILFLSNHLSKDYKGYDKTESFHIAVAPSESIIISGNFRAIDDNLGRFQDVVSLERLNNRKIVMSEDGQSEIEWTNVKNAIIPTFKLVKQSILFNKVLTRNLQYCPLTFRLPELISYKSEVVPDTILADPSVSSGSDQKYYNCTMVGNSAKNLIPGSVGKGKGGAMYLVNSGSIISYNCLFANNESSDNYSNNIHRYNTAFSAYSSLFYLSSGRNDNSSVVDGSNNCMVGNSYDPMLSSLSYNGGTTKTHALQGGSPAINAAMPTYISGGTAHPLLSFDQRGVGFSRAFGSTPDIGAYEFTSVVSPSLSVSRGNIGLNDGIDYVFGNIVGTPCVISYKIENVGNSQMTVDTVFISNNTNCSVTIDAQPSSTIDVGASSTLSVSVTKILDAAFSFSITIPTNDQNHQAHVISVSSGLAQVIVSSLVDSGGGTLREAIATCSSIGGNVQIAISDALSGQIVLSSPLTIEPNPGKNLNLTIVSRSGITIKGKLAIVDPDHPQNNQAGFNILSIDSTNDPISITLHGIEFKEGQGEVGGGAILCRSSPTKNKISLTAIRCPFIGNKADQFGGGAIRFDEVEHTAVFDSCYFYNNAALVNIASSVYGGAIFASGRSTKTSSITISSCLFEGNTVSCSNTTRAQIEISGGAFAYVKSGDTDFLFLSVSNSTFSENRATSNTVWHTATGGAFHVEAGVPSTQIVTPGYERPTGNYTEEFQSKSPYLWYNPEKILISKPTYGLTHHNFLPYQEDNCSIEFDIGAEKEISATLIAQKTKEYLSKLPRNIWCTISSSTLDFGFISGNPVEFRGGAIYEYNRPQSMGVLPRYILPQEDIGLDNGNTNSGIVPITSRFYSEQRIQIPVSIKIANEANEWNQGTYVSFVDSFFSGGSVTEPGAKIKRLIVWLDIIGDGSNSPEALAGSDGTNPDMVDTKIRCRMSSTGRGISYTPPDIASSIYDALHGYSLQNGSTIFNVRKEDSIDLTSIILFDLSIDYAYQYRENSAIDGVLYATQGQALINNCAKIVASDTTNTAIVGKYIDIYISGSNWKRFWFKLNGSTVGEPPLPPTSGDPLNLNGEKYAVEITGTGAILSSVVVGALESSIKAAIPSISVSRALDQKSITLLAREEKTIYIAKNDGDMFFYSYLAIASPSNITSNVLIDPVSKSSTISNLYKAIINSPNGAGITHGTNIQANQIFNATLANLSITLVDKIKTRRELEYKVIMPESGFLTHAGINNGVDGEIVKILQVGVAGETGALAIGNNDLLSVNFPEKTLFESQWYRISSRPCTLYIMNGNLGSFIKVYYEIATSLALSGAVSVYKGLGMPSYSGEAERYYKILAGEKRIIQFPESSMEYLRICIINPDNSAIAISAKLAVT